MTSGGAILHSFHELVDQLGALIQIGRRTFHRFIPEQFLAARIESHGLLQIVGASIDRDVAGILLAMVCTSPIAANCALIEIRQNILRQVGFRCRRRRSRSLLPAVHESASARCWSHTSRRGPCDCSCCASRYDSIWRFCCSLAWTRSCNS
jgi:hypothetical protein